MQARRKYDELADRYEEIYFYVADLGRRLVDLADPAPGTRVLDVGAGRGAVARAALAKGCAVTAVDVSPRMVERLAADHPEISAHCMQADRLDFPDDAFDLVTAGFVLQILDDPDGALAEIRRVLRPGATIAASVDTQYMGRLAWLVDLSTSFLTDGSVPTPRTDSPAPPADPPHSRRTDDLLARAGFTDIRRETVQVRQPIPDPAALWEWMLPRGLAEVVQALPPERAEDFRQAFTAQAGEMHDSEEGIVLDFIATLHLAKAPAA
ncbi:MAG: methyltransferase domain-containing protein [Catenulispora sp.]|nr:methyltransferase domain-containing protein [Catenulispora sp.]